MLKGTQNSRENATTEPTMLSARNFPNVLMSSLSMKSHSRSMTSCTCFIHFPCRDTTRVTSRSEPAETDELTRHTAPSQKPTVHGFPFRRNRKLPAASWYGAQTPLLFRQQTLQDELVSDQKTETELKNRTERGKVLFYYQY